MRIGIIGTGNMGRATGVRLVQNGHNVVFGAREAATVEQAAERAGGAARGGTNDDAAAHGDVLVWTIRDSDPSAVLRDPSAIAVKVVISISNRDWERDVQGGAWFAEAIAEAFQAKAPEARVLKALNLVAMEALDTSPEKVRPAGAQLFIAGRDANAKRTVTGLLAELGFETVDMGSDHAAVRAVEALWRRRAVAHDRRRDGCARQPAGSTAARAGSALDRRTQDIRLSLN